MLEFSGARDQAMIVCDSSLRFARNLHLNCGLNQCSNELLRPARRILPK